jgi:hypothetical protein
MRPGGIAAFILVLSCGGTETPHPAGTCMVTLSGAVNTQFDCTLAFMFWGAAQGGTFSLLTAGNETGYVATAVIRLAEEPRAGLSWSSADPGSAYGSLAVVSDTGAWTVDAAQPAYTLTISNLGVGGGVPGSKAWPSVHGTLSATLVPSPDSLATGTVTLSATF